MEGHVSGTSMPVVVMIGSKGISGEGIISERIIMFVLLDRI